MIKITYKIDTDTLIDGDGVSTEMQTTSLVQIRIVQLQHRDSKNITT